MKRLRKESVNVNHKAIIRLVFNLFCRRHKFSKLHGYQELLNIIKKIDKTFLKKNIFSIYRRISQPLVLTPD